MEPKDCLASICTSELSKEGIIKLQNFVLYSILLYPHYSTTYVYGIYSKRMHVAGVAYLRMYPYLYFS